MIARKSIAAAVKLSPSFTTRCFGSSPAYRNKVFYANSTLYEQRMTLNSLRICSVQSMDFSSASSASNASDATTEVWEWVPPTASRSKGLREQKGFAIPVRKGELITVDELVKYLEGQGAKDVKVLDLQKRLANINHFIFATGNSIRHIRRMSQTIVQALKQRGLTHVGGCRGAEGDKDDDWQLIDCHEVVVHIMGRDTRAMLDLESHWAAPERPTVANVGKESEYEAQFMQLLEQYPVPDGYNQNKEEDSDETTPDLIVKEL